MCSSEEAEKRWRWIGRQTDRQADEVTVCLCVDWQGVVSAAAGSICQIGWLADRLPFNRVTHTTVLRPPSHPALAS